jgi:hypothetical protein
MSTLRQHTHAALVVGARTLGAIALLIGAGNAFLILLLDTSYLAPVALPDWARGPLLLTEVSWGPAEVIMVLAGVAVGLTAARGGLLDAPALLLVAYGWGLDVLPRVGLLEFDLVPATFHSLCVHCATVVAIALVIVAVCHRRLRRHGYQAAIATSAVAVAMALAIALVEGTQGWPGPWVLVLAVATVAGASVFAFRWIPAVLVYRHDARWTAIGSAAVIGIRVVLALGAGASALAGRPAIPTAVLGTVLVSDAAILLSLRLRHRMIHHYEVSVEATPERVFAVITDYRGPQPWLDPEPPYEMVGDGHAEVGARVRHRQLTFVIRVLDPPRTCALEMVEPSYFGLQMTSELTPTVAGSRLRHEQRYDLPLYWALDPRYRRRLAAAVAATPDHLQRLRAHVEGRTI